MLKKSYDYILFILFVIFVFIIGFYLLILHKENYVKNFYIDDIDNVSKHFIQYEIKTNNLIPNILYQTGKDKKLSKGMRDAILSWNKYNRLNYKFYNDQECLNFLENNYGEDVLRAYHKLIPGAFKADLFRYCLLYIHGGIYADHKMLCYKSIQDVIPSDVDFVVSIDYAVNKKYLYNAFMMSRAGHPFLLKAIDMAVDIIKRGSYEQGMLCVTGPGLLGKAVNYYLEKKGFREGVYDYPEKYKEKLEEDEANYKYMFLSHNAFLYYFNDYISYKGKKLIGKYSRYGAERGRCNKNSYPYLYITRRIYN